ncbi:MAG: ABC transporter ATP-binding protein [Parvularculaceae bacterium]
MNTQNAPALKLENVTKIYKTGAIGVTAIQSVNLTIPRSKFTMLVGPSGSGKTTLLNLIGCIDTPTSGAVWIDGVDASKMKERHLTDLRARKIGFIFQNFNLIPVLSALENVEFGLARKALSSAKRRRAAEESLEAVGLQDRRSQRPNQLSGGEKQRVAIARALVKQPSLVLADEPTANLDTHTGAAVVDLMRKMQEEIQTTFVFSTHDTHLIERADELVSIRDGMLVENSDASPEGMLA